MNMGAYTHLCPRLETCMRAESREVGCVPCSFCFVVFAMKAGLHPPPQLFNCSQAELSLCVHQDA